MVSTSHSSLGFLEAYTQPYSGKVPLMTLEADLPKIASIDLGAHLAQNLACFGPHS